MFMSELLNTATETDDVPIQSSQVKYDVTKVKEVLLKKRIQGMSKKNKVVWLVGILLVLAASGYGSYKWLGTSSKTSTYPTATVGKATITDSIEATGTLSAIKTSEMGFKNDDTITAINVVSGDKVTKGQILAEQDPASLQSTLQQAQSSVDQDEISVKTAVLTNETNRKTLERQQQLFAAGAVSQTDLDTAQNTFTKSEWDVATVKSKLVNDQAKVVEAQADLTGATMVAPFDGIIGVVNGQVGSINGINSSTSTLLTVMSEDLQLSALINEADIGRIKIGQDVEFIPSAYATKTFKGKVLRITPEASTVSSVQYYPVLISCEDPDHQLLSGMSVSANIIVARKSDVLTVSMMAVSYAESYVKSNPSSVPTAAAPTQGTAGVVVVLENNQPTVKNIVLGLSDGSNYELISGLSLGDKVIVGSSTSAATGSSSTKSTTTTKSTTKSTTNQGGGGMGGPPPGM
ncbi:MAG: efflux RND transporter periplasmic adaptor subunit [Syntrophomonas sp.]|nr:efflux RND transporter periplasmic adaptor subunit [Syntrophomonas sp.]